MITSRRMQRAGHIVRMGIRGLHIGYWWESQKKERERRRWVDNIKMALREIERGCMNWIDLA
jgi:hypothetical protein